MSMQIIYCFLSLFLISPVLFFPPQVPRRRSVLPSHLHSVMGSANLSLARGETSAAVELCMEVIRQGKE